MDLLRTSCMDPYVSGRKPAGPQVVEQTSISGWWATMGTYNCAEETPKIARSQLSQSLFSSIRSQFHSQQLLEKIVVTGFNLIGGSEIRGARSGRASVFTGRLDKRNLTQYLFFITIIYFASRNCRALPY